jgi:hypothetical protein
VCGHSAQSKKSNSSPALDSSPNLRPKQKSRGQKEKTRARYSRKLRQMNEDS